MSLLKRKFEDEESGMVDRTDCYCKFRGTEEEQEYHRQRGEIDAPGQDGPPEQGKKCLADDITFGQVIEILNYLVKEVAEINRRLDG